MRKPPIRFARLNQRVADYNGLIAKYHSGGYKQPPPSDLIEAIINLGEEIDQFLKKPVALR